MADDKKKDSEWNGSKHYRNLVCSLFPLESNFDMTLSSPDI
jgi:hypothetical protein